MPTKPAEGTPFPAIFLGHGSPMNAIEDNPFSRSWKDLADALPRPRAILCVSAHWESRGPRVSSSERPGLIYDFYGFPRELGEFSWPAPGQTDLAAGVIDAIRAVDDLPLPALDPARGLDHGCWCPLSAMYPDADISVVQLSLDRSLDAEGHWRMGASLRPLRDRGILILCSGNIVHNLGLVDPGPDGDLTEAHGYDWAVRAEERIIDLASSERARELCSFKTMGTDMDLAAPTDEHFLPLLYALGLRLPGEDLHWFNEGVVGGSISMASCVIGG